MAQIGGVESGVDSFVASNDKTDGKRQDGKVEAARREALKRYQAAQESRQSNYLELGTKPAAAPSTAKPVVNVEAGLRAAENASAQGMQLMRGLESLLVEAPAAKPMPQFEAKTPAARANPTLVEFSPELMRSLPAAAMVGTLLSGDEKNIVVKSYVKVMDKLAQAIAQGPGSVTANMTSRSALTPAQKEAFVQAFMPVSRFLGRQSAALAAGKAPDEPLSDEPPPDEGSAALEGVVSADSAAPDASQPDAMPPLPDNPADASGQVVTVSRVAGHRVPPVPGYLEERAFARLGAGPSLFSGLSGPLDIDSMIEAVMMECEGDVENELRDMAAEMQQINAEKAKQRQLQQAYRLAHSDMERQMRMEFGVLQQKGKIADGWTFDDYAAWRQVAVAPPARDAQGNLQVDGNGDLSMPKPTLAQPSPPELLPPFFSKPKNPEPNKAGSDGKGRTPGDPADDYGLTKDQESMLEQIFTKYFYGKPSATALGIYSTDFKEAFQQWLEGAVGLKVCGNNITDVVANNQKISDYLNALQTNPGQTLGLDDMSHANKEIFDDLVTQLQDAKAKLASAKDSDKYAAQLKVDEIAAQLAKVYENYYFSGADSTDADNKFREAIKGTSLEQTLKDKTEEVKKEYADKGYDTNDECVKAAIASAAMERAFHRKNDKVNTSNDPMDPNPNTVKTIKVPTAAEINGYKATQSKVQDELQGASFFQYGLSTDEVALVNALYEQCHSGALGPALIFADAAAFATALGLEADPTGADPEIQKRNAQRILEFIKQKAGDPATVAGLTPTQKNDVLEKLSSLEAQAGLATQTPVDFAGFGLTKDYADLAKQIWLGLPTSERDKFGDFAKFLTSPDGLNLQAGGDGVTAANQASLRAYVDKTPSAADAAAKLDLLAHPIDKQKYGFSPSTDVYAFMEELWNRLSPAERASFGGDINRFLTDTPPAGMGLGDNFSANETALANYCAGLGAPYPDKLNKAKSATLYDHTKKADSAFGNEYLQWLHDKGFVGDPPPLATEENASGINPQTGDNVAAGVFAQNLPAGMEGEGQLASLTDIDNMEKKADDDLQSMSEMSELKMMRLQLLMDRRSKFLEAVSNVMKKISTTDEGIIANIKV